MFIDYLTVSFELPYKLPSARDRLVGTDLAQDIYTRIRIHGEDPKGINGATHIKIQNYPGHILIVIQHGGADLPIDLNDFCRHFKRLYKGWRLSRIDLADNITNVTREQVYYGKSANVHDYHQILRVQSDENEEIKVWTGGTYGKRGTQTAYMRIYDCRRHEAGKEAKINRHKSCDFWRLEYELGRRCLKQFYDTIDDIDPENLMPLFNYLLHQKGVKYGESAPYVKPERRDRDLGQDYKMHKRYKWILQAFENLDPKWQKLMVETMIVRENPDPRQRHRFDMENAEFLQRLEAMEHDPKKIT